MTDHIGDRAGKYFLAPETAPGNCEAFGEACGARNVFATPAEAVAAIPPGPDGEWNQAWVVSRYGEGRGRQRTTKGRYAWASEETDP